VWDFAKGLMTSLPFISDGPPSLQTMTAPSVFVRLLLGLLAEQNVHWKKACQLTSWFFFYEAPPQLSILKFVRPIKSWKNSSMNPTSFLCRLSKS
jgi:hypothetical protein